MGSTKRVNIFSFNQLSLGVDHTSAFFGGTTLIYFVHMIYVVCQHEILSFIELYGNIQLHTFPTPNPQILSHEPQYYPQSHYSHTSNATQDIFSLTQPQQKKN